MMSKVVDVREDSSADQALGRAKGSERIQINNILSAVCVGTLSVLLTLHDATLNSWSIGQLAAAIPCLVTSSLAYAKLCYRHLDEYHLWDTFAWLTHSIGYILILNSLGIMLCANGFTKISIMFASIVVFLFVAYSMLDIWAKRYRTTEKVAKLAFYVAMVCAGFAIPAWKGWF